MKARAVVGRGGGGHTLCYVTLDPWYYREVGARIIDGMVK